MPDERQDSIRQGINPPRESEIGQRAADARRRDAAEGPAIGGGMGGTSDADSPADESAMRAAMRAGENDRGEGDRQDDSPAYWNLPSRLRGRILPPE